MGWWFFSGPQMVDKKGRGICGILDPTLIHIQISESFSLKFAPYGTLKRTKPVLNNGFDWASLNIMREWIKIAQSWSCLVKLMDFGVSITYINLSKSFKSTSIRIQVNISMPHQNTSRAHLDGHNREHGDPGASHGVAQARPNDERCVRCSDQMCTASTKIMHI